MASTLWPASIDFSPKICLILSTLGTTPSYLTSLPLNFYNDVYALLSIFRKEETEEDGFYNGYFVTQHDLLRELTILQSSSESVVGRRRLFADIRQNKFPQWWLGQKQPISARLFSVFTGY